MLPKWCQKELNSDILTAPALKCSKSPNSRNHFCTKKRHGLLHTKLINSYVKTSSIIPSKNSFQITQLLAECLNSFLVNSDNQRFEYTHSYYTCPFIKKIYFHNLQNNVFPWKDSNEKPRFNLSAKKGSSKKKIDNKINTVAKQLQLHPSLSNIITYNISMYLTLLSLCNKQ